jgi:hypothetical protein
MLAFTTCILLGTSLGLRMTFPAFLAALGLSVLGIGVTSGLVPALLALIALETGYPIGLLLRSSWTATHRA